MARASPESTRRAKEARFVITLDTGALIAIERRRDRMMRVLRAAEQTATPMVPAVVLAEWWRGRVAARMMTFLEGVTVEPVDEELARVAGEALAGDVRGATTIDALVMASAALRGGVVYTSDLDDLQQLGRHFPDVRVRLKRLTSGQTALSMGV